MGTISYRFYRLSYGPWIAGKESEDTLVITNTLCNALAKGDSDDKTGEARVLGGENLALARKVLGDDDPATLCMLNSQGSLLHTLGRAVQVDLRLTPG